MSIYHDLILDHYNNPRNFGELPGAGVTASERNIGCGDDISISLFVDNHSSTIRQLRWRGSGCAISTAAASLLSEHVLQAIREVPRALEISEEDMINMLGGEISATRRKCATLALKALRRALRNTNRESEMRM